MNLNQLENSKTNQFINGGYFFQKKYINPEMIEFDKTCIESLDSFLFLYSGNLLF